MFERIKSYILLKILDHATKVKTLILSFTAKHTFVEKTIFQRRKRSTFSNSKFWIILTLHIRVEHI